jgi:cystathionine beta-synthase
VKYETIYAAIGNTPLVRVPFEHETNLYAKLEYCNPGGSVKDRSALYIIEYAEKHGLLKKGGTIIDASSGNHGISTAMIGAMKGYDVIMTVSEKNSLEKKQAIEAYGAKIVLCPAVSSLDDPRSYHSVALRLASEIPGAFLANQYYNIQNREGHYYSLGPEIWRQTEGKITHFFAAAGTGGTVSGAGRFLKEQNAAIKVIALDSDVSYRSTGGNPQPYQIEGIGVDFDTPVLDYSIIDEFIGVSDDHALPMLQTLARKYGLLVGPSSGAVAYGAHEYARKHMTKDDLGVIIFGDSGRAYLTKNFY